MILIVRQAKRSCLPTTNDSALCIGLNYQPRWRAEADPTLPVKLSTMLIAPEDEFAQVVGYCVVNG